MRNGLLDRGYDVEAAGSLPTGRPTETVLA